MHFLRLKVDDQNHEFDLRERCTIGRAEGNTVCLPDPMVAKCHAVVDPTEDGQFVLRDLGSRHGTFVEGRRVSEAFLSHGDEILIGIYRFRFEDSAAGLIVTADAATAAQDLLPRKQVPISDPNFPPASAYGGNLDELKQNYERLRAAFELSRAVGVEPDVNTLLERVLDTAFQLLGTDRGAILLYDNDKDKLDHQVARTRAGSASAIPLSQTIINEVVTNKAAVLTGDTAADERFHRARSICVQNIRSAMAVPLMYRDEVLGVMHLDSQIANNVFDEKDLELFTTMAGQAAMAVKNAVLMKRIRRSMILERLDRVVSSLPEGLLLLDSERRVILCNGPMEKYLPMLSERAAGEPVDRLGDLDVDEVSSWRCQNAREVVAEGPPRRVLAVTGTRIEDEKDSGSEYLLVVRDVTEERDRERRARQQDQLALLGQLASGVAHDFNNLLTVILNYAELMESRIDDPDLLEDFSEIRQAGTRAAALTKQLLAFSRRQPVESQRVDANRLLADIERLLELSVSKKVALELRRSPSLPLIDADPTQIEQVIINLAVNARDAMPDGGTLVIETSSVELDDNTAGRLYGLPGGRYAQLCVQDSGCGMSAEVRARIFEPFYTTKEEGRGTGLGLAMVLGIVTRSGGAVSVDSEAGQGTTFRVLFPSANKATPCSRAPTADSSECVVLVVDDDQQVRRLLSRSLRREGLRVVEAGSGRHALEIFAANRDRIAGLVTDVVMPGMSGMDLVRELGALGAKVPVLYISGKVDGTVAGYELGKGSAFVAKPFATQELIDTLKRLVGKDRWPAEPSTASERVSVPPESAIPNAYASW